MSPEYKAGSTAGLVAAAVDGESVWFESIGVFSGAGIDFTYNPYLAKRTSSGWVTTPLGQPATGGEFWKGPAETSADLSRFAYVLAPGENAQQAEESFERTVWVREPDGSFVQASPLIQAIGKVGLGSYPSVDAASRDLSRLVLGFFSDGPGYKFVPGDEKQEGGEEFEAEGSSLRLLAVNNNDRNMSRFCATELGGDGYAQDAVSQPDASEVLFSTVVNNPNGSGQCGDSSHPVQLFVRANGSQTLEVSKPLSEACAEVPCQGAKDRAPAEYQGASEDGSKVFFTTPLAAAQPPLVPGDTDASRNLYVATIGCPGGEGEECGSAPREVVSLVQVSHDPTPGQPVEVQGDVTAISPDGSHVYFVARGVLTSEANGLGQPAALGADNLYVHEPDPEHPGQYKTVFIADLCSGPERSGGVRDRACPGNLETESPQQLRNDRVLLSRQGGHREAQTTKNGDFLVFSSYGQLIRGGPERDTDTARDVYRYDALTGRLQRVSVGEAGYDANGNNSAFDASITAANHSAGYRHYGLDERAVSEDGTVAFTTAEPLSGDATNGQPDVYVWHEGRVALISSGASTKPDEQPVITPSGRDIFFRTAADLLPGDTDGLYDVYDARIGGGFPPAPAAREECSEDACQGPLTNPAPLLVPGSVSQPAGGNLPPPAKKVTPKKLTRAQELARALKVCAKKSKSKRAACRRSARKKYAKAAKSAGRGRR